MSEVRELSILGYNRKIDELEGMLAEDSKIMFEQEQQIERLSTEHGDMNVHCVKLEKENERLMQELTAKDDEH